MRVCLASSFKPDDAGILAPMSTERFFSGCAKPSSGLGHPVQRADLVAIRVTQISQIELARRSFTKPWWLLTRSASVGQSRRMKRIALRRRVHGKPISAIASYWQQQIFAGGELPPAAKSSDDEVIAFVRATPGGIGYVSAGASLTGVKAVTIK